MMTERITRVLLTLDCDTLDTDALRVLTVLAGGQGLELTGMYVQDEDLIRAARLPGSTEVSLATGAVTRLSVDELSRQLATQAERAKAQFESSTQTLDYKTSFTIARGRAVETVAEEALGFDILVIARSLRAFGLRSRHGSHFQSIITQQKNILFVNEPWASGSRIVALCESPEAGCESALNAARRFADIEQLDLLIAVPQQNILEPPVQADRVVTLTSWTEESIAQLCEREDARLLVVPPGGRLDWQTLLVSLVDRLPCSLLRLGE